MNESTKSGNLIITGTPKKVVDMSLDELAQFPLTSDVLSTLSEGDLKILCQRLDATDPEDLRAAIDRAKSKMAGIEYRDPEGNLTHFDQTATVHSITAKMPKDWAEQSAKATPVFGAQMSTEFKDHTGAIPMASSRINVPMDASLRASMRRNLFARAQDEAASVPYVTISHGPAIINDAGEPVEVDGDNQGDASEQNGEEEPNESGEGTVYSDNTNDGHFGPSCEL